MTILEITSLLVVLAGVFGSVNYFFLKLPASIGILVVALAASLAILTLDRLVPGIGVGDAVRGAVLDIEFSEALLHWMLGLLLFAGALHVPTDLLRKEGLPVAMITVVGVLISTALAGFGFAWITGFPLLVAMVFGALISPTDPVAVLDVLRAAKLRKSLEVQIAGESLFNDGLGYVLFLLLAGLAFPLHGEHHPEGWQAVMTLFLREAVGGALLGAVLGWLTFLLIRRIDDYALEVLISLALALGGYELAVTVGVSGPITAVMAGLFIGNVGKQYGMGAVTQEYLDKFWEIVDEILNAVLFLLIGIEVFALSLDVDMIRAGALAIGLSLLARLVAVSVAVLLLHPVRRRERDVIPIMTWGGLKGGISVALALSLPASEWKPTILAATYFVVVFSIIVQGLTVAPLARWLERRG